MAGTIVVTMNGYWLSAAWLRLTARPFVVIDGAEQRVRWGIPAPTAVDAGTHKVAGGIRYPGFSSLMGLRDVVIAVSDGQTVELTAKNGLFNSEPFYISPVRKRQCGGRCSSSWTANLSTDLIIAEPRGR